MTAVLKRATFTTDDYDRMLRRGDFAGKSRVELLEGVIYEMSPLHLPHARAQFVLTKALDAKAVSALTLPGLDLGIVPFDI
jgi:Uma2 family endonuclease